MGCDIHLHIEVKIDGAWHHYGAPSIARSYRLFEKMAGVRGEESNAIAYPKGVPDDATFLTKIDYKLWDTDAHSASWLGVDELMQLEDWLRTGKSETFGEYNLEYGILHSYLGGNGFTAWKRYPQDGSPFNPWMIEDVRLVFWFDN